MDTHIPRRPRFLPSPEDATPEGLLDVGGRLDPEWLLDAYTHGIFPWPVGEGLLAWWSPDPRAIIEPDAFHVSRRLWRTWRSGRFQLTCDRDFTAVLRGCATAQDRRGATWLTRDMRLAYATMFELGYAHSVEVWHEGQLAGGTYGIALGGMFAAESMFYRVRDASKVALAALVGHLQTRGFALIDIQQLTPHTESMGAREIPRAMFFKRLREALQKDVRFGSRLEGEFAAAAR